jgi:hypothetical protein
MNLNCKKAFNCQQSRWFVGFLSLLIPSIAFTQTNNFDISWWLNQKSIMWSAEANHFRTGIEYGPISPNREINILIMSLNKKGLTYVFPPSGKFPMQILRDESGAIIDPVNGKTEGELPKRISANDLPHTIDGKFRGHGTMYQFFLLGPTNVNMLADFKINDIYDIKKAGNYTLTVFPVVYGFETNYQFVDRVDLPVATTKIFLFPSQ